MKEYPLMIEYCTEFEGYVTMNYYSKGHQDKQLFANALTKEWEHYTELKDVEYKFVKLSPCPTGGTFFNIKNKPCRGSFPVTIVEI